MSSLENSAVVVAIFEDGWNRGEFSQMGDWLAPEVGFHVHGSARTMHLEDLRRVITAWRRGFPDLEFQIHEMVSEGDLVASRLTLTGTHLGEWGGRSATGNRIAVDHMFLFRFEGGVVVDVWEVPDTLSLRQQLDAPSRG